MVLHGDTVRSLLFLALLLAPVTAVPDDPEPCPPDPEPWAVFLAFGDSKTMADTWPTELEVSLPVQTGTRGWDHRTFAAGGDTVAIRKALIDADLATVNAARDVRAVLINLGVNDAVAPPPEANWKADYGYMLDAVHAKWPNAHVYLMRVWGLTREVNCATLNGYMVDIVAARSEWAHLGPDEGIFLENGDGGTTYTVDGIHPNAAGLTLSAAEWKAAMGY